MVRSGLCACIYLRYLLFLWLANRGYADLPRNESATSSLAAPVWRDHRRAPRLRFFYKPEMLREPLSIFRVWEGGMSSHGGMLGLLLFTCTTRTGTKSRDKSWR